MDRVAVVVVAAEHERDPEVGVRIVALPPLQAAVGILIVVEPLDELALAAGRVVIVADVELARGEVDAAAGGGEQRGDDEARQGHAEEVHDFPSQCPAGCHQREQFLLCPAHARPVG